MNKNELRNTILSQIQLPCIGKNRMQVEPVSGQMQTRQLQQAIDDLSWRGGGTLVLQPGVYRTGALHLKKRRGAAPCIGGYSGAVCAR